ncbi:unnamed protein product [Lymnaea stagnalis]|uniref:WD repeat and coiled-coil-containing protein n=1 Tax=Lymnaea stagnalis TaxID=6523 RepID=A0AAV2ICE5_LYMST
MDMELGRSRLRKVGINNLHSAVHPDHGVLWTDGKGIYLAPIHVEGDQLQNAASVKLGEFEQVVSVHWSLVENHESCHMCVVHQQNVTVWRVTGVLPKLSFKQVRKINVRPIPQGCLWNPVNDVLCLVSKQQCSFYFKHDTDKGSYGFPTLESGKISSGCWSTDGHKLVLCVGAVLLVYRWSNVSQAIGQFSASAWKIPGLDAQIVSISPVLNDAVVVAAEVPLENLFKREQGVIKLPDVIGQEVIKDDIIRPNSSLTPNLFNLQLDAQTGNQTGSSLSLINLGDGTCEPLPLSTVPLKGVLTPDILLYEKNSQCVIVGSNTQSQLHIFALLEKHLAYCGDVQLEKSQRPKGLCSMQTYLDAHGAALLILVGQRDIEESGFLSPSMDAEYKLSLKYIILKGGFGRSKKNSRKSGAKTKSSTSLNKSESLKEHRPGSESKLPERSESMRHDQILAYGGSSNMGITLPSPITEEIFAYSPLQTSLQEPQTEKMIEELSDSSEPPCPDSIETVTFSGQSPHFSNAKLYNQYELHQRPKVLLNTSKESPSQNVHTCQGITAMSSQNGLNSVETQNHSRQTSGDIESLNEQSHQITQNLKVTRNENDHSVYPRQTSSDIQITGGQVVEKLVTLSTLENTESKLKIEMLTNITAKPQSNNFDLTDGRTSNPLQHREQREASQYINKDCSLKEPSSSEGDFHQTLSTETDKSKSDFRSTLNTETGLNEIEEQIKAQKDSIACLQRRLEEMSRTVEESCCIFPNKYQELSNPEIIEICFEKPDGCEKKKFLLDNGRLHLESVKLAFGLATVEILLDGVSCVVCANIDGYIPIKFSPFSEIKISGLPTSHNHDA